MGTCRDGLTSVAHKLPNYGRMGCYIGSRAFFALLCILGADALVASFSEFVKRAALSIQITVDVGAWNETLNGDSGTRYTMEEVVRMAVEAGWSFARIFFPAIMTFFLSGVRLVAGFHFSVAFIRLSKGVNRLFRQEHVRRSKRAI